MMKEVSNNIFIEINEGYMGITLVSAYNPLTMKIEQGGLVRFFDDNFNLVNGYKPHVFFPYVIPTEKDEIDYFFNHAGYYSNDVLETVIEIRTKLIILAAPYFIEQMAELLINEDAMKNDDLYIEYEDGTYLHFNDTIWEGFYSPEVGIKSAKYYHEAVYENITYTYNKEVG